MGVDISHIIKHEFRDLQDKKASIDFCKDTINRLNKNLLLNQKEESFCLFCDKEGEDEITFRVPLYDVEFTLHSGFWQIESYFHYCQIVMHEGEHFWLRRMTYDLARALGEKEAWYAEEYYTWNGGGCEEPDTTFEEWLTRAVRQYGKPIPEFDQQSIIAQGNVYIPNYEPIYHDSFKECYEKFEQIQEAISDYKLLGIKMVGNCFIRCEKDGQLFLFNEESLCPLFKDPIESIIQSLNGPEFIVIKGELSAVYDRNGNQMTYYVPGRFDWKWAPCDPHRPNPYLKRIIFNEEAHIEIEID